MKIKELISYLPGVKPSKNGYEALCPAHDDKNPSLSINKGEDERILLHCFAGCTTEDIVAAAGLTMSDLFPSNGNDNLEEGEIERIPDEIQCTYPYHDENGNLLYEAVRYQPKTFKVRKPNENNTGYTWSLNGTRRVLYNLPSIIKAKEAGVPVFVVEGEKDADNLHTFIGAEACVTTSLFGAGKWLPEYTDALQGCDVVIFPDNDSPGISHAQGIIKALHGVAKSIKYVMLPGLPEKGDVSDWIEQGHSKEELWITINNSLPPTGGEFVKFVDFVVRSALKGKLSPPDEGAYWGLAGKIVKTIEPHSEADPIALLIQLLVAFGNNCGSKPYFLTEADKQHTNLFAVLVGRSSRGRKGTSWTYIRRLFEDIDPSWVDEHVTGGLSSGEGIISAVQDNANDESENSLNPQDKRLLVMEPEFATALKVLDREGNILSPIIRQAWDSGNLRTLTKNSPLKATGTHISIVGHITQDELKRCLNSTELANGFANRFLWVYVTRSKLLPEGGNLLEEELLPLKQQLKKALDFAKQQNRLTFTDEARKRWHEIYPELSRERPGLLGSLTSRAEAQTIRLASLYALLDESSKILLVHLEAALVLLDYVERSCSYIFGDKTGQPEADKLLQALRQSPGGLAQTQITRDVFKGNKKTCDTNQVILYLEEKGLIKQVTSNSIEKWVAVT